MKEILGLFEPILEFGKDGNWKMIVMWAIGGVLIYLAIKKQMEPTLLLPIGFGAILMKYIKMALEEDNQNFLLMHSIGVNVSGQIASVIAGSLVLGFFI